MPFPFLRRGLTNIFLLAACFDYCDEIKPIKDSMPTEDLSLFYIKCSSVNIIEVCYWLFFIGNVSMFLSLPKSASLALKELLLERSWHSFKFWSRSDRPDYELSIASMPSLLSIWIIFN